MVHMPHRFERNMIAPSLKQSPVDEILKLEPKEKARFDSFRNAAVPRAEELLNSFKAQGELPPGYNTKEGAIAVIASLYLEGIRDALQVTDGTVWEASKALLMDKIRNHLTGIHPKIGNVWARFFRNNTVTKNGVPFHIDQDVFFEMVASDPGIREEARKTDLDIIEIHRIVSEDRIKQILEEEIAKRGGQVTKKPGFMDQLLGRGKGK